MGILKVVGSIGKGIFRGVKDVIGIPQIRDSVQDLKVSDAVKLAQKVQGQTATNPQTNKVVNEFLDILDDGQRNQSHSKEKAKMISRIVTGFVPLVAYLVYGIASGEWAIWEILPF